MIKTSLLEKKPENSNLLRLSVSKAKTFVDCKAKYKFCYIEKLPRKEWHFHIFGQFLHFILETFHAKLIEDPTLSYKKLMKECWDLGVEEYKPKLNKEQKDEAFLIIKEYLDILKGDDETDTAPKIISVEKEFFINVDDTVLLNGYIDRIQIDPDGVLHVADYKTTKNKKYLNDFFQLLTYALVLMLEDPKLERIRGSYILLRHGFERIEQEFTRKDVEPIAQKYIDYAERIKEEQLWRPSPTFLCSFCDYLEHCKAGEKFLIKKGKLQRPTTNFGLEKW